MLTEYCQIRQSIIYIREFDVLDERNFGKQLSNWQNKKQNALKAK